ncbi:YfjI family protein [Adonisia turfae]
MDTSASSTVRSFLSLLYEPGDVLEVRAPKCRERAGSSFASTVSGYFNDHDAAAEAIAKLDTSGLAPGVYVTLNPVRPDLLARAANRLRPKASETTADADVPRRRWMLVDVDPVRPAGVSATDEELSLAERRTVDIRVHLAGMAWPEPAVCMSGNGYHLLYRVELPGNDDGAVRAALTSLADRFSDDAVAVDRSVFNPARIIKAIGTVARKGDDLRGQLGVPDRPHRRSEIVHAPENIGVVTPEMLASLAEPTAKPVVAVPAGDRFPADPAGVRSWLEARGVSVKGERRNGTKTMLLLERCPVDPAIESTGGSDIAVLIGDDGKLAYCNKHSRGADFTWHDLRRAVDTEYAARGAVDTGVDLSGILGEAAEEARDDRPPDPADPGPLPPEMLRLPGFVGEVMDHCLRTAPYPNQTLAFCGALALQAVLAGRKVRDPGDNRTNLYLLGLAHSSAGKDQPRKVNSRVLQEVGLAGAIGERLASGEGIQDSLFATPAMLFQTDEIDTLLQSINRSRDARFESMMSTLLTMYSSANSIYPMRRRANNPDPGVIDQPCLVLFGTAIPNHYYAALSERMLTNGLFARMLIFESGPRGAGQEPDVADPPPRVLDTARWWADQTAGDGNLAGSYPSPKTVPQTPEAKRLLVELREQSEREYADAESRSDAVATTVWGRVSENARKLALLYAISENHREPEIGAAAVRWASHVIVHQTTRMLFMAAGHAAETPFDELALRAMRKLRESPGKTLRHSVLLKRMKIDSRSFHDLMETLIQRSDVRAETVATAGRTALLYRLAEKEGEEGVNEGGPECGL